MSKIKVGLLTLSIVVALLASACGGGEPGPTPTEEPPPNAPPTVILGPELLVPAGESKTVPVAVQDPEDDPVTCQWSATRGTVPTGVTACGDIEYTAPDTPGTDTISVIVSDRNNPAVTAELTVSVVEPPPPTLTPTPEPSPTPTVPFITITDPQVTLSCTNDASVDKFCLFRTSGEAGGVETLSDLRIYLFVFPVEPPGAGWYLQRPPAAINSDGTWSQTPGYLGSEFAPVETGQTLQVRAALVTKDATYNGRPLSELSAPEAPVIVLQSVEDIEGIVAISDVVEWTVDLGE